MDMEVDWKTFERFLAKYRASAIIASRRYAGGNRADAEDLLADVKLRMARAWASGNITELTWAYMERCLRNRAIDWARKAKARGVTYSLDAPRDTGGSPEDQPRCLADALKHENACEDLARREDLEAAAKLLEPVPELFRVPVEMAYLRDMSYQEIGSELGIPNGTVRSRIHRGIKAARKHAQCV